MNLPPRLRGYVLLLVMMLTAMLSIGVAGLMYKMTQSAKTTSEVLRRKRVFYETDGMVKSAVKMADTYFRINPNGYAGLAAWFDTTNPQFGTTPKAAVTPSGYDVDVFSITANAANAESGPIPNGPFSGMNAEQIPVAVSVQLRDRITKTASRQTTTVVVGQVSAFQFFGFVDGYAYLVNGPGGKMAGRIHTNGNACAGASGNLYLENLTSAGDFGLQGRSGVCRGEHGAISSWRNLYMPSDPLPNGFNTYSAPGWASLFDQVTYDSSSGTWKADAESDFGAQLQDQAHGVPRIQPPISGTPKVQRGRSAAHAAIDNTQTSRFLVDPILNTEAADVRSQKIAYKADIRILNGVWFKRNPSSPEQLGTPIWSDRPGTSTNHSDETWTSGAQDVGQESLFGGSTRPNRYSYYRTDSTTPETMIGNSFAASTSFTSDRPVVSYGPVVRKVNSGIPYWVPGYYKSVFTPACNPTSNGSGTPCWDVLEATSPAQLAQGTRSGFRDPWMETAFSTGAADCSANRWTTMSGIAPQDSYQNALFNILPMNFDVIAFQQALADTSGSELGSHFSGGADFNGIVWIGATWPGSEDGYGDTASSSDFATYWPYQGAQNDTRQPIPGIDPTVVSTADRYNGFSSLSADAPPVLAASVAARTPFQRALPLPLCSTDVGVIDSDYVTFDPYPTDGGYGSGTGAAGPQDFFRVPDCADYFATTGSQLKATINGVRLINGRALANGVLPSGLSIVTNLPMYVLGDLNSSSTPAEEPDDFQAGWVPLMVGGDSISILSNAWEDDEAPWNVPVRTYWDLRDAADTRYHGAFLFGWNESDSGCRDEFSYSLRLQEHWNRGAGTPYNRVIRGSLFIGFSSVYGTAFSNVHETAAGGSWHDGSSATKYYAYDYHFDSLLRQPPGAPTYTVNAVRSWRRD